MTSAWELPTSLTIGGIEYEIRSDFRAVIDILTALNDPDTFDDDPQTEAIIQTNIILQILYPNWESIPEKDIEEALRKACEFIDMGISDDTKKPRVMDWEQDAPIIIPAINKVLEKEVRAEKYIHWWTFLGAYMEIGEGLFSNVIGIRQKKAHGEKLEKWEQKYYKDNKAIIDLKTKYTAEELAEQERLKKILG